MQIPWNLRLQCGSADYTRVAGDFYGSAESKELSSKNQSNGRKNEEKNCGRRLGSKNSRREQSRRSFLQFKLYHGYLICQQKSCVNLISFGAPNRFVDFERVMRDDDMSFERDRTKEFTKKLRLARKAPRSVWLTGGSKAAADS